MNISSLTDDQLADALADSGVLNPKVAPELVHRVTFLLVQEVGLPLDTARRVSRWLAPQIALLAEIAHGARRERDDAEAFIGSLGLLASYRAHVGERPAGNTEHA